MSEATAQAAVRVQRRLPVPPDAVFRAWLDPAGMGRWISPVGHAEVVL